MHSIGLLHPFKVTAFMESMVWVGAYLYLRLVVQQNPVWVHITPAAVTLQP